MVTSLDVRFPVEWAVLPCTGDSRQEILAGFHAAIGDLGNEAQAAADQYFQTLTDRLGGVGVSGIASLMIVDEEKGDSVRAVCAVGTVDVSDLDELSSGDLLVTVAESGPHPGLDRHTERTMIAGHDAVRSTATRWAGELADTAGWAPYVAEFRYVFPTGTGQLGILHFQTDTVVYLDDLASVFDAIADTVQLS